MARPRINDASVRLRLLDAAMELLAVRRPDEVSVREIAEAGGASTTAIYALFGSKPELVELVRANAAASFAASLARVPLGPDPLGDLRALGRAYVEWACDNQLYGVLFNGAYRYDHAGPVGGADPVAPLMAAIHRGLAAGVLAGSPSDIGAALWVTVHGVATLARDGVLDRAAAEHALASATDALLRGWAPGPQR